MSNAALLDMVKLAHECMKDVDALNVRRNEAARLLRRATLHGKHFTQLLDDDIHRWLANEET